MEEGAPSYPGDLPDHGDVPQAAAVQHDLADARAAYSVPANIAEGYGRLYPKDKARIYNIAFSSAEELKYFLILSKEKGYRTPDPALDKLVDDVSAMLRRLTDSILGNG